MQIRNDKGLETEISYVRPEAAHFHEALEVLFLLGGNVELRAGDDSWKMKPDDIIVINSGIRHQIISDSSDAILCRLLIPRSLIVHTMETELFLVLCNSVADPAIDYENIRGILKDIVKHCLVKNKPDLYYQGKFYQLLYALTEHYLITSEDVRYRERVSKNEERIQQILSYIQENYNKDITLNELADKLYLTNSHLSRFFKKTFNVNFMEYLNTIKLHHAVEDLLYTSKTITRIAMDNGFFNMATFNKMFKTTYQMTPKAYREAAAANSSDVLSEPDENHKQIAQRLKYYIDDEKNRENGDSMTKVSISVDTTHGSFHKKPWKKLINVGDMASLRDYRVRSELLRLNSSLKFTYARVWNVLSNDMLLGRYISDNVKDYDFSYLDECIDFLQQHHLKPFFQMGYKRARYQNYPDVRGVSIASAFSFTSAGELLKVLHLMLRHLLIRYGQEEMNTWCFEIWYPTVCYYVPDFFYKDGKEILSKAIYKEIRKVLPEGKIGGAEFTFLLESDRIYEDLLSYKDAGINFDFITCVSFPYKVSKESGLLKRNWQANGSFMGAELACLKQVLKRVGWEDIPIWITEYSFTVYHRNLLNDTRFKGAYVLKNMSDISEVADAAGYWLLSDVYSEGNDTNRLLYGGSGIVTKDGINKPVYYALYFLTLMKPLLIGRGENYFATTDGYDAYSLLLFNTKELNHRAFMKTERDMTVEDLDSVFEDDVPVHLELILENATRGKYRLKRLKIDRHHGDVQEWTKYNATSTGLKRPEIWHLQQTCMPDIKIYDRWLRENEKLVIEEQLEANNFLYYEIEKVH